MSKRKRKGRPRRKPTTTVYYKDRHCEKRIAVRGETTLPAQRYPFTAHSLLGGGVAIKVRIHAPHGDSAAPPSQQRAAHVRTALVQREYLDDRPVTEISRRPKLRTLKASRSGSVVVRTFYLPSKTVFKRFGPEARGSSVRVSGAPAELEQMRQNGDHGTPVSSCEL